jgi:glycosyltransferase involved in cell wall biosynthesis
MKILMVLESDFPPDVRVENEILALSEAGHEIHLACSTRKNSSSKEKWGIAVIHRRRMSPFIYKSSVGCLKFPFYFNFWREFIFGLLAEEKFDAIHIHDLPLAKIGAEAKHKFKTRLVIDLHENWPALIKTAAHTRTFLGRLLSSNRQWVNYEKSILPEADMVITIIEEARERIIRLGIDPAKVGMVSNTINFENLRIKESQNKSDSFIIFYGGAINKHRGLQVVLEAIKICAEKNCKANLWIVGDGSFRKTLEESAASLNIESHVRFFGHRPFNEMLDLLAEADAAIIPHIRTDNNDASSPNKLYQYMYLNKPIISSDCASLERIINETKTGFIYPYNSPEELAALIVRLHDNPALLADIEGNGRRTVVEKYNWNTDKQRLIAAYSQLLSGSREIS